MEKLVLLATLSCSLLVNMASAQTTVPPAKDSISSIPKQNPAAQMAKTYKDEKGNIISAGSYKTNNNPCDIIYITPVKPDLYKQVTDKQLIKKYNHWLANDAAKHALGFYKDAWQISHPDAHSRTQAPFYIALVPGGNNTALGFSLENNGGVSVKSHMPYIKLDPDPSIFTHVLLHETGHMILMLLNGGNQLPVSQIASIPHSTAAITDRTTAFDEGFAIHFETYLTLFTNDKNLRELYEAKQLNFGVKGIKEEYLRQVADIVTFSQTRSRYYDVLNNNFSFTSAFKDQGYLRTQLDKSRDFSSLRNPDQLLQSEGFYASFFISIIAGGQKQYLPSVAQPEYHYLFKCIYAMFKQFPPSADSPYLLELTEIMARQNQQQAKRAILILNDLSHGVFIDPDAAAVWKSIYTAAINMDLSYIKNAEDEKVRNAWNNKVLAQPSVLYAFIHKPVVCSVPKVNITLIALEDSSKLSFDLNTVEEGVIKLVPDITPAEVNNFMLERSHRAFENYADFEKRCNWSKETLNELVLSN